jgi:predicted RNase H-like HicB family nuclease
MDQVKTYTVLAERDEAGWWAVRVPELPGVFSQARRLDHVEEYAREAIDLAVSVGHAPKGDFALQIEARVPELDDDLATVRAVRADAERLQAEAAERTRVIARQLADKGLTVRDIGATLGVSYQRAAQLVGKQSASTSRAITKKPAKRTAKVGSARRRVTAR